MGSAHEEISGHGVEASFPGRTEKEAGSVDEPEALEKDPRVAALIAELAKKDAEMKAALAAKDAEKDAALAAKDAEKDAALAEKDAALAALAAKDAEMAREKISRAPRLEEITLKPCISTSGPSEPKSRLEVERLNVLDFPYLSNLDFEKGESHKMLLHRNVDLLSKNTSVVPIPNEATVANLVTYYLSDLLVGMGMSGRFSISQEIGKMGIRPDIYMLFDENKRPVGVVEVKKPLMGLKPSITTSLLDRRDFQGQIYDYLMFLKMQFSLPYVIGILTTFQEFRICWLDDIPPLPSNCPSSVFKASDTSEPSTESNDSPKTSIEQLPRTLNTSAILTISEHYEILNDVIGTTLLAMAKNMSFDEIEPFGADHPLVFPFINRNNGQIFWTKGMNLKKPKKLSSPICPIINSETIILVRNLGVGAHGYVWLAATESSTLCVIKFKHLKDKDIIKDKADEMRIEKEHGCWNLVHEELGVHTESWRGETAIVMPYFAQASLVHSSRFRDSVEASDPETMRAVERELRHFVAQGVEHGDVKWGNIGFYSKGDELQAVLFDLASHTIRKANWEGSEEWVQQSLKKLREEIEYFNKNK